MRFILTKELGRLVKWLRILGFDARYYDQDNLSSLIIEALREDRIIITRNHRLPKATGLRILTIEAEKIKEQVSEIMQLLKARPSSERMFTRCILCNEELTAIEKEGVKDKVPEYVFKTQGNFVTCPKCKRIYWQGTHWGNVQSILNELSG